jgi:hypothetical protein
VSEEFATHRQAIAIAFAAARQAMATWTRIAGSPTPLRNDEGMLAMLQASYVSSISDQTADRLYPPFHVGWVVFHEESLEYIRPSSVRTPTSLHPSPLSSHLYYLNTIRYAMYAPLPILSILLLVSPLTSATPTPLNAQRRQSTEPCARLNPSSNGMCCLAPLRPDAFISFLSYADRRVYTPSLVKACLQSIPFSEDVRQNVMSAVTTLNTLNIFEYNHLSGDGPLAQNVDLQKECKSGRPRSEQQKTDGSSYLSHSFG